MCIATEIIEFQKKNRSQINRLAFSARAPLEDAMQETARLYVENIDRFDPAKKASLVTWLVGPNGLLFNELRKQHSGFGTGGDDSGCDSSSTWIEQQAIGLAEIAEFAPPSPGKKPTPMSERKIDGKFYVDPRRRLNAAAMNFLEYWSRDSKTIADEEGLHESTIRYRRRKVLLELELYEDCTGMGFEDDEGDGS